MRRTALVLSAALLLGTAGTANASRTWAAEPTAAKPTRTSAPLVTTQRSTNWQSRGASWSQTAAVTVEGCARLSPGTTAQPKQRLAFQQKTTGTVKADTTIDLVRNGGVALRWTATGTEQRVVRYGLGKPGDTLRVTTKTDGSTLRYDLQLLGDGALDCAGVGVG